MAAFTEADWPPEDLSTFLRRPHIQSNLDELKNRLRNCHLPEDLSLEVIQQVLFEAIERAQQFATGNGVEPHPLCLFDRFASEQQWWTYLFAACYNRGRRAQEKAFSPLPKDIVSDTQSEPSPSSPAGTAGQLDILSQSLSIKQRAVIVLLREGFSQAEISQVMGVSPSRVSQLKETALRHLRRLTGTNPI